MKTESKLTDVRTSQPLSFPGMDHGLWIQDVSGRWYPREDWKPVRQPLPCCRRWTSSESPHL